MAAAKRNRSEIDLRIIECPASTGENEIVNRYRDPVRGEHYIAALVPGRRSILSANAKRSLKIHTYPRVPMPWGYALSVQRFDLVVPAGSRIHGNHIEFDLALDNDKTLQESAISLSQLEDVLRVDFQRLVRTEFGILELGHRARLQPRQRDRDL